MSGKTMTRDKVILAKDYEKMPWWFHAINKAWKASYPLGTQARFDKDTLIRLSRKMTGLTDFGKDFDDEPLDRLIQSIEEEANLHPLGRMITQKRLVNLLNVRLRAEHYFRKYPEILEQPLYPVMMIIGLQRTGTTRLQRLLATDPDNRALMSWEAINPAPFHNKKKDPRIGLARTSERALKIMAPHFFAIHPVEHLEPEEDILLLDVAFLSTTPEATMHVPSYAKWLEETDQTAAYSYAVKLMKLLQWQQPGKRWVLKSPHHLEFLDVIDKAYGDVSFFWTHREPARSIPSFMSMVSHSRMIFSDRVDKKEVAKHWLRKTGYMLNKAVEFRQGEGNEKKFTDIFFDDFVNDPVGHIEKIYSMNGGLSPGLRERMIRANDSNPKNKYGIHRYNLEWFGINEEMIAESTRKYREFIDRKKQTNN
jgi:hypothetical protein